MKECECGGNRVLLHVRSAPALHDILADRLGEQMVFNGWVIKLCLNCGHVEGNWPNSKEELDNPSFEMYY